MLTWIVSWLLQKTFQINFLVAFTSMRKLQWQLVLFFWIVWLQGLTICSPIRFRFLIIIMGRLGAPSRWRASDAACLRLWLMIPLCVRLAFQKNVSLFVFKSNIYIYCFSFFQQHRTAYPSIRLQSRVAMQALVLEAIATVHLQSNFIATAPFFLFTFVYWQDTLSVRDHIPHRGLLPTLWMADSL
jgi:hypothetical protein